jgi:hypothetical protein
MRTASKLRWQHMRLTVPNALGAGSKFHHRIPFLSSLGTSRDSGVHNSKGTCFFASTKHECHVQTNNRPLKEGFGVR